MATLIQIMSKRVNDIYRVNQYCEHFPCHEGLEDCVFCFCPLYPCKNEERGGKFIRVNNGKTNQRIWDCTGCNWIHKKEVVDRIFELIRGKVK
jgi:Zn-finger protein